MVSTIILGIATVGLTAYCSVQAYFVRQVWKQYKNKKSLKGGVEDMARNHEEIAQQQRALEQPQAVREVEINLTLINNKVNYLINLMEAVALKSGVELPELE